MDFMSTYQFVLVTEWMVEADFVSGEWSQAILAGAVPVRGRSASTTTAPQPRGLHPPRRASPCLGPPPPRSPPPPVIPSRCAVPRSPPLVPLSLSLPGCAVQIYMGAPNIVDYSPGPHSYISGRDFSSGRDMAKYVGAFLEDAPRYSEMHDWRQLGLSANFKRHLDNCVHFAECRLCEVAHKLRSMRR
jgi:hypothetical protein